MSEQEIEVGQVWRRKKDGKLILIMRQWLGGNGTLWDDWTWGGYDYEGKGQAYGDNIRARYTLESEADR
jgi:hypothetical protein